MPERQNTPQFVMDWFRIQIDALEAERSDLDDEENRLDDALLDAQIALTAAKTKVSDVERRIEALCQAHRKLYSPLGESYT